MSSEFRECAACAAKPGAPLLCDSCRHNRRVIAKQDAELEHHRATLRRLHGRLRRWSG